MDTTEWYTDTVLPELPVRSKRDWIKLAAGDFDPNAQRKKTFHHWFKGKKSHDEQVNNRIPSVAKSPVHLRGNIRQSSGHCLSYPYMSSCHLISFSCCFPLVSAMEVPSGQLSMVAITWHNLTLETSLTFWESKGKQTLRTQTRDPGQNRSYIDLAAYFSFSGTHIQS